MTCFGEFLFGRDRHIEWRLIVLIVAFSSLIVDKFGGVGKQGVNVIARR